TGIADNARQALETALVGLGPQQREIILLYHQFNWAIARIADHLNMPEGTVKSHLHRARKRMRRRIEADRRLLEHVQEIWA
ncbi:MAG: sigma-70 family RNA polymerase sigma factor, partial [Planctomycetes bacterium]|nr:sigma-70 family RNA polymerase sigma factor [Planctomycetota bacterium]